MNQRQNKWHQKVKRNKHKVWWINPKVLLAMGISSYTVCAAVTLKSKPQMGRPPMMPPTKVSRATLTAKYGYWVFSPVQFTPSVGNSSLYQPVPCTFLILCCMERIELECRESKELDRNFQLIDWKYHANFGLDGGAEKKKKTYIKAF